MYHIHRLLAPIRSNSVFSLAQLPKPSLIGCRYKSNNVGSQDSKRTLKNSILHNLGSYSNSAESEILNKLKPITPNDLYVSCTSFDRIGNITAVSRKYPKMQFLKENHLFPRDLRKIDTSSIDVVPVIMIRPSSAILVNLLHIKAIIKRQCDGV